jgi:CRISPR/Cas system-associated exonuclease Cas4 (RecB family)
MELRLPLSPSRINTFCKCPKHFWFEAMEYHGEKGDERHSNAGTLVHKVIEKYFEVCSDIPKKNEISYLINSIFEEEWQKSPIPGLEDKVKTCIKNFIKSEQTRVIIERENYKPTHFEVDFESFPLHGYADWYNANSGIVRDWKTNASMDLSDDMMRQGLVYKYVLEQNGYKVNMVIFELLYTNTQQILPIINDDWLFKFLKDLRKSVDTNFFPKKPGKNKENCKFCPYKMPCEMEEKHLWELLV